MVEGNPYKVSGGKVKRRVRMVAVSKDTLEIVNKTTGEVTVASPYVGKRQFRDIDEFVKVYNVEMLYGLKPAEYNMMIYALSRLNFEGKFMFDEAECLAKTGLSARMLYYGLKGLLDRDFIRRDKRGAYWVNPNIAFRGSRDDLLDFSLPRYEERDSVHEG